MIGSDALQRERHRNHSTRRPPIAAQIAGLLAIDGANSDLQRERAEQDVETRGPGRKYSLGSKTTFPSTGQ